MLYTQKLLWVEMTLVSIVMALSENDKVSDLEVCSESIASQIFTNHETIIVSDGYIPVELHNTLLKNINLKGV